MNKTKNDCSADTVQLDYEALLKTATYAYVELREQIGRKIQETYSSDLTETGRSLNAGWIAELADKFQIAAETRSALQAGLSRSRIEVINRGSHD